MGEPPHYDEVANYAAALYARFGDSYKPNSRITFDSLGLSGLVSQFLEDRDADIEGSSLDTLFASQVLNEVGPGYRKITPTRAELVIDDFEQRYGEVASEFEAWYDISEVEDLVV